MRVDPGHVGRRVETLPLPPVAAGLGQPELLPVAQGPGGEAGQLGHLTDAKDDRSRLGTVVVG